MGLDQYIYRIRKPKMENRAYTTDEIDTLDLRYVFVDDAERNKNLYHALLLYAVKRDYTTQFYNLEKIAEDYNMPSKIVPTMFSADAIGFTGYKENGDSVYHKISSEEVEKKYIITKTLPAYFWEEEEISYWRKNYELQDWMNVENIEYVLLNANLIHKLNNRFWEDIPEEDPGEDEALFYWEWY